MKTGKKKIFLVRKGENLVIDSTFALTIDCQAIAFVEKNIKIMKVSIRIHDTK